MQSELKEYLRSIRKNLPPLSYKKKNEIITELSDKINQFILESDNGLFMEDIYNHFGTAEDIAEAYKEMIGSKYIGRKFIYRTILYVVIVLLLIIWYVSSVLISTRDIDGAYYEETIIETEE